MSPRGWQGTWKPDAFREALGAHVWPCGPGGRWKPTGARNRMFDRRVRTGWDADGAWRVSETERQIFDFRRNVTRVDRRICARSMGIAEGKLMVRFEEAVRRARKRVRDVESFEVQLCEFFMAISQMKVCLGEWTVSQSWKMRSR